MKSIMMSIRPKWVVKILNGEKTIEVRKKFPVDYVGWVYIYCTKENDLLCQIDSEWSTIKVIKGAKLKSIYNGKVVARFWCDKVEEIKPSNLDNFAKDSCLTIQELENYLWSNICCGYAIHISKLEIFNKPRYVSEFYYYNRTKAVDKTFDKNTTWKQKITHAPQSWCYIEGEK